MLDPVRAKFRLIGVVTASFVGGVMLASGMEWTPLSQASTAFQSGPDASQIRPLAELSQSFISIAESVTPAVVSIRTRRVAEAPRTGQVPEDVPDEFRRFFEQPRIAPEAGGTGFLIRDDGFIVTNNHVVADAIEIRVVTMDRREYRAELIGRDPMTDVAVIRIDGTGFPTVRMGDPHNTRVGEWVIAVGNPLGLDFTVTAGIVSAKDRSGLNILAQAADEDVRALTVESFIQTDAAINPGNSGGPLVNIRGEVIGINTAIASSTGLSQGYGFAVPIDLAWRVADDLIRYGRWQRSVLGVSISEVDPEAVEAFGLPAVAGAVVQSFSMANTPAERAGLQQGDVIVAVDGEPIRRLNELQRLIASRRPGDRVRLDVIRYGQPEQLNVQLIDAGAPVASAPAGPAVESTVRNGTAQSELGIRVGPISRDEARRRGFSGVEGVMVIEADPGGLLARRHGDPRNNRIISIDRQQVADADAFERMLRAKAPGSVASLLVERPGGQQSITNVRLP
jgi:serine protease Do